MPLINKTTLPISCWLHVYNSSGKHIADVNQYKIDHVWDVQFVMNETDSTILGLYSYIVQCNSSTEGGWIAYSYEVTKDGLPNETELSLYIVIVAIAFIFLIIGVVIYLFNTKPKEGEQ
jgi:cbb3-type cytochrome oxidase subunit 3